MITFTEGDSALRQAASVIVDLAKRRLRRMELEQIDGVPAADTPLGSILTESGFRASYKGLVLTPGFIDVHTHFRENSP